MGKPAEQLNCTKISDFPRFKCVKSEDRDTIEWYSKNYPNDSCEYSFANLYAWQDLYKMAWSLYEGRLLICDGVSDHVLMPQGESMTGEELLSLSLSLRNMGLSGNIAIVSEELIEENPDLGNHYEFERDGSLTDYIYSVERLIELKGSRLHKKKNLISQFVRAYPDFSVEVVNAENRSQCLSMAEQLLVGNMKISRSIREEHSALKAAIDAFDAIGLEGLLVRVEGRVVAFSLFSRLNERMFDIHFEKADRNYKGAAQVINYETAKFLEGRCEFFNREQDLGIPGLRQAKMTYDPVRLHKTVTLKFIG